MRAVVVIGSAVAHAVVLWWLSSPKRPLPVIAVATSERAIESQPIEVSFLVEEERQTAKPPQTPSRSILGSRSASRAAEHAGGEPTRAEASTNPDLGASGDMAVPSGSGTSLMKMRGADLGLDPAVAERIASAGGDAPRDELRKSGKLKSQPGGGAIVHDTVTTLTVDPDGGATFHDKPDLQVDVNTGPLALLDPEVREEVRVHVKKWLEDPWEGTRYRPSKDLPRHLQAVPGACDTWGSDFCDDPLANDADKRLRALKRKLGFGISGTFDATAYLHRKLIGDPYASRKLKLLDETRDERIEMGIAYRAKQQLRSAELMQRNLERLWAEEMPPAARRALLFELWDECSEDEAGLRARSLVIGSIRARMPRDSEHAFSDEEIAALQTGRSSTQLFAPYE